MGRNVRDLMTANPLTVPPETSVFQAARLMRDAGVGVAVVTDSVNGLVGVLTDRDIVTRVVALERDTILTPISEVLSAMAISVGPDDDIERAGELMGEHAIRRLPVVDGNGAVVGILALGDFVGAGADNAVLKDISAASPNT
jgi:CBS domain-containing protein